MKFTEALWNILKGFLMAIGAKIADWTTERIVAWWNARMANVRQAVPAY